MRIAIIIFWILIGFIVLGIFSLNAAQSVNVDLFFYSFQNVDVITVMFSSMFFGFLLGLLVLTFQLLKFKKEQLQLRKIVKTLQGEIKNHNSSVEELPRLSSGDEAIEDEMKNETD